MIVWYVVDILLWLVFDWFLVCYFDVQVELSIDFGFVDIVVDCFDVGVWLGEVLVKDMIVMWIGFDLSMVVVVLLVYFVVYFVLCILQDLVSYNCINLWMLMVGGLYVWEFEKDGCEVCVWVEGQFVCNDVGMIVDVVVVGRGLVFVIVDVVVQDIVDGWLVCVLEDWCLLFFGYYFYYLSWW